MKNVAAHPAGHVEASITSITLVNNTAKTQDVTVPDDTEWEVQFVRATNPDDVQRSISIFLYNESAKTNLLGVLTNGAVNASSYIVFPQTASSSAYLHACQKLPLKAGMTISVTWAAGGASTGGTDARGLVVVYRERVLT